jgi:hypothetical protein
LFFPDRWTNATPLPPPMAPRHLRTIPMVDRRTNWPARGHVISSRSRVTWSHWQRTLFLCSCLLSVRLFIWHIRKSLPRFVSM